MDADFGAGFGIDAASGIVGIAGIVGIVVDDISIGAAGAGGCSCCMGVILGDFGFFLEVAGLGAGLSPLYMDREGVLAAAAVAAAASFWVVNVDASFFCIGILGAFVTVGSSSRGRPSATGSVSVVKDRQTSRQRRNTAV
jgi:hypothetical protein